MGIDETFTRAFGTELPEPGLSRLQRWWRVRVPDLPPANIAIVGTNGKGTVSWLLDQYILQAGLRSLLFTSPHIRTIRERIRVNGDQLSSQWWQDQTSELADWNSAGGTGLSYFEAVFCLAVEAANQNVVDVGIWEAGLGGRLDAINVIPRFDIVLLPQIGLDHTEFLGDTVEAILREKLGVLRPRTPLIVGDVPEHLMPVVERSVKRRRGYCIRASSELPGNWETFACKLAGKPGIHPVSARVFAWACVLMDVAAVEELDVEALKAPPGRMQEVTPGILCDVAHNADAVSHLAIEAKQQDRKLVFNLQKRKDLTAVCAAISAAGYQSCAVLDMGSDLGFFDPQEVVQALQARGLHATVVSTDDVYKNADQLGEKYLVFGSFIVVQQFLEPALA